MMFSPEEQNKTSEFFCNLTAGELFFFFAVHLEISVTMEPKTEAHRPCFKVVLQVIRSVAFSVRVRARVCEREGEACLAGVSVRVCVQQFQYKISNDFFFF